MESAAYAAASTKTSGTTPLGKLVSESAATPLAGLVSGEKNKQQTAAATSANGNTPNGNLPGNNMIERTVGVSEMTNDGNGSAFDSITVNNVTVIAYTNTNENRKCSEFVARFYKSVYGLGVGNLYADEPDEQPSGGVVLTNSPKVGDIVRFALAFQRQGQMVIGQL